MTDTISPVHPLPERPDLSGTNASSIPDTPGAQSDPAGAPSMAERVQQGATSLKLPLQDHVDDRANWSQGAIPIAHPHASADTAATFNDTLAPLDPASMDRTNPAKVQAFGSTQTPKAAAKSAVPDPIRVENRAEAVPAASPFPALPLHEASDIANAGDRRVAPMPHAGAPASWQMPDPFVSIDSGRGIPAPTWIHAGARHAEAGYLDPSLGWIGVRADTSTSGVHASLVPASGEAAQVLGTHLAGLNDYLAKQHGDAATVTMAAPQEFAGTGTNAQQQQERQSSRDEPTSGRNEPEFYPDRSQERSFHEPSRGPEQAYAAGARYISVMV